MRYFFGFFFAVILSSSFAFAQESHSFVLPDWYARLLPATLKAKIKVAQNNIQLLTPIALFQLLELEKTKLVAYGYNGAVFKTGDTATKLNFHSMIKQTGFRMNADPIWQSLYPFLDQGAKERITTLLGWGGDTSDSAFKEILGYLTWFAEEPDKLHLQVSNDFQAIRRPFIEGIPLKKILSDPNTPYHMEKIWAQVIHLQNRAEKILFEIGLSVDLTSSGNIIVQGSPENPNLIPIDFEMVMPAESTFEYYQKRGIQIKRVNVPAFGWIVFPLIPESILTSKLWNLSFEQSIDYIMARFGIQSRIEATAKLASIPKLKLPFPEHETFTNVDFACSKIANGDFR